MRSTPASAVAVESWRKRNIASLLDLIVVRVVVFDGAISPPSLTVFSAAVWAQKGLSPDFDQTGAKKLNFVHDLAKLQHGSRARDQASKMLRESLKSLLFQEFESLQQTWKWTDQER
jgi:hypothetical protein